MPEISIKTKLQELAIQEMKILFLDLDGTVRRPKSGAKFISTPDDQEIIPAAAKGMVKAMQQDFILIGITNQGGIKAGFKSLDDCIKEQRLTMELAPELTRIYFCPDDGETAYGVSSSLFAWQRSAMWENFPSFRKPETGMLKLAMEELGAEAAHCWMIGGHPEDLAAAEAAGVPFLPADIWHQRFSPGFQEMERVTAAQLEFLEGVKYGSF